MLLKQIRAFLSATDKHSELQSRVRVLFQPLKSTPTSIVLNLPEYFEIKYNALFLILYYITPENN